MTSWVYDAEPHIKGLPQLLKARMRQDAPLIGDGDAKPLSYGEYWNLAGRLANAMAARGVEHGDRVAVQAEKSITSLALFLACARLGAVFLPLNTAYTAAELDYFIGDAQPSLLVCSPERIDVLQSLASRHGCRNLLSLDGNGDGSLIELAGRQSDGFEDRETRWDDLAAILYTSGTTGRSKGAMLTHGNLASNALSLCEAWQFTRQDVLLHALPIYHTHGLFTASNTILLSGGSMIFRSRFDAGDIIARLPQATTMMGVPTFYTRLLQQPALGRDLVRHMRLFVSGSAPLLAETHRQFQERTGHAILERYGMTETNMNTSNPYVGKRRPGTVGLPLPGISVRIAEPSSGVPLPQGETGMIEVKGPNVFKGYWRMPGKTAEEFRPDGYFITGDLGVIDGQGYVSIVGRGKDLIISGGFNVYPKEVESEIDGIAGVLESAVIGIPHPDFGEGVTAVVVPDPEHPALAERDVVASLEARLAKFKLPKRVLFVSELPRNAMGKVQKNVLRESYAGLYT